FMTITGAPPFASTASYGGGGSLLIGDARSGTVTITGQGALSGGDADRVVLGRQATGGGSGTPGTPAGLPAAWTPAGNHLLIGESGSGTLTLYPDTTLVTATSNNLVLAKNPGSTASVIMAAGSSWTETTQSANIAGIGGGSAALIIASGATLDVPGLSINPH